MASYFKFRELPGDAFRFFPFSDPRGERLPFDGGEWPFREWPFGPGTQPWDRQFFEEFEQFFENGLPFDFERDPEGGSRGDSEGGIEDFFGDGDRGFRFRGDGGDGSRDSFCFRDGDEEQCPSATSGSCRTKNANSSSR